MQYLFSGGENIGQQEVQQCPQLVQVVLQRRAGQQQSVLRVEHAHCGTELTRLILQTMCLVDDQVVPGDLGERGLLQVDYLVSSDHHIPLTLGGAAGRLEKLRGNLSALFFGSVESVVML